MAHHIHLRVPNCTHALESLERRLCLLRLSLVADPKVDEVLPWGDLDDEGFAHVVAHGSLPGGSRKACSYLEEKSKRDNFIATIALARKVLMDGGEWCCFGVG